MSSGENVIETMWTWECPDCRHQNDDVTSYIDGFTRVSTCEACDYTVEESV